MTVSEFLYALMFFSHIFFSKTKMDYILQVFQSTIIIPAKVTIFYVVIHLIKEQRVMCGGGVGVAADRRIRIFACQRLEIFQIHAKSCRFNIYQGHRVIKNVC